MRTVTLLATLALPVPVAAHPHVFVDSQLEVRTQGSLVTAVRLTWTYDDFFTLFLLEDLGLDPEADGVLTVTELATLEASITDWPPDFSGDLVLTYGEEPVPLSDRRDHRVEVVDGRLVESHVRLLASPVDVAGAVLTIENYDPYYYVAYSMLPEVAVAAPCDAALIPADPEVAQAEVDSLWQGLDIAGAGPEMQLPPVGYAFSDRVEVQCGN
jgi:ABC-type uncharacterized transport system substrate-binding protein